MQGDVLFRTGSAEITAEIAHQLQVIAQAVAKSPHQSAARRLHLPARQRGEQHEAIAGSRQCRARHAARRGSDADTLKPMLREHQSTEPMATAMHWSVGCD